MYSDYYFVPPIGDLPDNSLENQIPYPHGMSELHATGSVYVHGTPEGSTLKVHSGKDVVVFGTGSKSAVEVHADPNGRVGSVAGESTVGVYAKKVQVLTGGRITPVTKTVDQYVTVKPNAGRSGLNIRVASIPVDDPSILKAAKTTASTVNSTPLEASEGSSWISAPTVSPKGTATEAKEISEAAAKTDQISKEYALLAEQTPIKIPPTSFFTKVGNNKVATGLTLAGILGAAIVGSTMLAKKHARGKDSAEASRHLKERLAEMNAARR